MKNIPVYEPFLCGNEKDYVIKCLDSNWISSKGSFINKFEKKFAEYLGVKYATTVTNGTVALHLALLALGIGPGDEVIVPSFTYIASVNAISYVGAKPIFVDSEDEYWQIDVSDIRNKLTNNTKAIMAVHLYGHPCDMISLQKLCDESGLFLIEDAAESLGAKFHNQYTGSIGSIATFSLYGNKTITTGEGGIVVTNDRKTYELVNLYKSQGVSKDKEYWHDVIGYNYRMTNICAAIGLAQLENIEQIINRKREIANLYRIMLEKLPIDFHSEQKECMHSYWMCSVLVRNANQRKELREYLKQYGIETRPTFPLVHKMPMYNLSDRTVFNAEKISKCGINLPSSPKLSNEDIKYICERIGEFYS